MAFYENNFSYRQNFKLSAKDHKLFQQFPLKESDSEVEPGSFLETSRRYLPTKNEIIPQENTENKTILQALSEYQRDQLQESLSVYTEKSFSRNTKTLPNNNPTKLNQLTQSEKYNIQNRVEPIRLMRGLKLLVNIQQFFRTLSMNARIYNRLTQHQHNLIGDSSSIYSKSLTLINGGNMFNNFMYFSVKLRYLLNKKVFTPSNFLIKSWDSLQSFLIIFSTFLLNLELFFQMDIQEFQLIFQILFNVSVIDIFVVLNTGVLQKGILIYDRIFIVNQYMKNTFFLDLLGNIPLFFYISKVEVSTSMRVFINILFTFKWVKISKVLNQIAFYVSYEKDHKNIFDLFKLLVFVIGICHVFCLFWHGLVQLEINNGITNNWLATKNLLDASIYDRYIYSFYFLAVTMATVGYGDITPQNTIEVLFTTITIFVTCVVYAFSLNTIGGIIENIEKKDKKYKENLQIIHALMREEEVSRELKIQVSNYIEYLYKESNEIQKKQEKLIIQKLSTKLRNDLTLEIQGKYISNIPLFKSFQEKDKIAKIMEEQLYSPAETIFTQGDIDDSSLYYIVKGSVSIIFNPDYNSNREAQQIQLKQRKEYFGEISFITSNPRTFTAKAIDFCKIYKIKREHFLSVIQENDQNFEHFQMIKEAISFNNNFKFCSITCSICKSEKHFSINCPKIHLTLNKQLIISRYNSKCLQDRTQFKRRRQFKLNYFQKIKLLKKSIKQINNNESLFEILDIIENESVQFDLLDGEINFDFEKEDDRKIFQRGNTAILNQMVVQNEIGSKRSENLSRAFLTFENHQEQSFGQVPRKSRRYSSINQIIQQLRQSRKSVHYRASQNQQLVQSEQINEICDTIDNNSQTNIRQKQHSNNFKTPSQLSPSISSSSSSSSSSDGYEDDIQNFEVDGKGIQSHEKINIDKQNQNLDIIDESENKQNQILIKQIIDQQKDTQQSNQNNLLKNSLKYNDLNEQIYQTDKKINNSHINIQQQQNGIILNNRARRLTRKNLNLENLISFIENNNSVFEEDQKLKQRKSFQVTNGLMSLKQTQQISPNSSLKQINVQNQTNNTNNFFANQFQQQSEQQIFLSQEKKVLEANESQNQVNYLMLQIFDKAKIFKYYLPNYNYPEIVQKWMLFQSKQQKSILTSMNNNSKKKRQQNKRKQSSSKIQFKNNLI
ncbi:hypothetical protein ABPG72_009348 [Tetrahymena utriculariae]